MSRTKRVHVNQHIIKSNLKNGEEEPVVTVKTYNSNDYGHAADIVCECGRVAASVLSQWLDGRRLSCGATVYVEVPQDARVVVRRNDSSEEVIQ